MNNAAQILPLTAQFNSQGRKTHRLVVGMIEGYRPSADSPITTVFYTADIGGSGYSREISVDMRYDAALQHLKSAVENNEIADFSDFAPKPVDPVQAQGLLGRLLRFRPA